MNTIFEAVYTLRSSDFDCYERLSPVSVLDFMQEIAGRHSIDMALGFHDMLAQNKLWVLAKVKYEVVKEPQMHQTVRVRTWPLPPGPIVCQRETQILDMAGELLIKATAEWLVIDKDSRKIMRTKGVYPEADWCTRQNFDGKIGKLHDFETVGDGVSIMPAFCDWDQNGHVNNTRYAAFVLNAWQPSQQESIKTFEVHYHRELLPGVPMVLHCKKEGDTLLAVGKNCEGERVFSCGIQYHQ